MYSKHFLVISDQSQADRTHIDGFSTGSDRQRHKHKAFQSEPGLKWWLSRLVQHNFSYLQFAFSIFKFRFGCGECFHRPNGYRFPLVFTSECIFILWYPISQKGNTKLCIPVQVQCSFNVVQWLKSY